MPEGAKERERERERAQARALYVHAGGSQGAVFLSVFQCAGVHLILPRIWYSRKRAEREGERDCEGGGWKRDREKERERERERERDYKERNSRVEVGSVCMT